MTLSHPVARRRLKRRPLYPTCLSGLLALTGLSSAPAMAQTPAGTWFGLMNDSQRVLVHLDQTANGYTGWIKAHEASPSIPEQYALDTPIDDITADDKHLSFHIPTANGIYAGDWDAGRRQWTGRVTWSPTDASPLDLAPSTAKDLDDIRGFRPQEDWIRAHPFPHTQTEVSFANPSAPGVRLAGTFSAPAGLGPFPAVVLVTGSGRNTRDSEGSGHLMFVILADALNRAGIAVLRYDKRGVGASQGEFAAATTADFASDAEAAVNWLRTQGCVAPSHIGVIGHSEGGTIAPMLAARDPDIAFVVSLSGVAVPGYQALILNDVMASRSSGMSEKDIAGRAQFLRRAYAIVLASKDRETAEPELRQLAKTATANGQIAADQANGMVDDVTYPWIYHFARYDPAPLLHQVRVPVLAIYGARDTQVSPTANVPALREALSADSHVTIVEIPGLNHKLQPAPTGAQGEYSHIPQTMSPVALKLITTWVRAQVK